MKETLLTASRRVLRELNICMTREGGLLTEQTEIAFNTLNKEVERAATAQKDIRAFIKTFPNATAIPVSYITDFVNLNDDD